MQRLYAIILELERRKPGKVWDFLAQRAKQLGGEPGRYVRSWLGMKHHRTLDKMRRAAYLLVSALAVDTGMPRKVLAAQVGQELTVFCVHPLELLAEAAE
jgi:hypothetical protein